MSHSVSRPVTIIVTFILIINAFFVVASPGGLGTMGPGTEKRTDGDGGSRDIKVDNGVHYTNWSTQEEWSGSASLRYRVGTSAQGNGIGI